MGCFLATIWGLELGGLKILGNQIYGLLVHAAHHVLSATLHLDEPRVAEFLEMETDGRRDFVHPSDATTNFANGWARYLSNLARVCDRHWSAGAAKVFKYSQPRRVSERFEHFCGNSLVHESTLPHSSRNVEMFFGYVGRSNRENALPVRAGAI